MATTYLVLVLPEHPAPLPEHGSALLNNCPTPNTTLLANHYKVLEKKKRLSNTAKIYHKYLRNNSSDASISGKTGQVPVASLLEDVNLVPDKCLQMQILLHLEMILSRNVRLLWSSSPHASAKCST